MITKIIPINPYLYAVNLKNSNSINNLMTQGILQAPNKKDLFTYKNYTVNGMPLKFIFKNGHSQNGSIFEDGISNMLQSSLLVETWG